MIRCSFLLLAMLSTRLFPAQPITFLTYNIRYDNPADGTFNGFKFHEPVTRRIDYIFAGGPTLKVLKYAVLSDSRDCHYSSDHLPVLARLEW